MPGETDCSLDAGWYNVVSGTPTTIEDWLVNSAQILAGYAPGFPNTQYIGLVQFKCNQVQGATIANAVLDLMAVGSNGVPITIHGIKQANTPWPSSASVANGLARTTASTTYTSNIGQDSPDVTAIVQEVVNQGTFAAGNDILFVLTLVGTGANQGWDSNGSDPTFANRPTLTINGGSTGPGGQSGINAAFFLQLMDEDE